MQTPPSLRELFDAAVDLPAAARSAWLDEHCRDARLRRHLERLLIADSDCAGRRPTAQGRPAAELGPLRRMRAFLARLLAPARRRGAR